MKRIALAGAFMGLAAAASAMTVAEAYRAIPHRQTIFRIKEAKMATNEKAFLDRLFQLMDQAIVAKMETMQRGSFSDRYGNILKQLGLLAPPKRLEEIHRQVMEAVQAERDYLKDHPSGIISTDPLVKLSSFRLHDSYNKLMARPAKLSLTNGCKSRRVNGQEDS